MLQQPAATAVQARLAPPREPKLGEIVASRIKQDIADLGWPIGHVFGSQTELMRRYEVSRATLREAVRQVERHGIARMHTGMGGGLIVQQPAREAAVLALAAYLELAAVKLHDLLEARSVLEELMITLACERGGESELAALSMLVRELRDAPLASVEADIEMSLRFRRALVSLSRNPALMLMLEALYRVSSDLLSLPAETPQLSTLMLRARREKIALAEAVIEGDSVQAGLRARASLERARKALDERVLELGLPADTASTLELIVQSERFGGSAQLKLGHRTSLRIALDARRAGPGGRLGSEAQLCERHDVSRAVLREALRTLEPQAIVRAQRGARGGLVACAPDSTYTIELTATYLEYARLRPRHFYELWRALQIACTPMAAARIDAAGRARMNRLRSEEARPMAPQQRLPTHGRLHALIGELSRNPALALFMGLLDRVGTHYQADPPSDEIWSRIVASHAELCGLIGAGEAALARRAMLRHLKLLDVRVELLLEA